MKKHTLNISVVSIICILGAVSFSDAFAAGSVRALGGTGTFNGTTAATTSARAGSLRISPSTTRVVSTGTRTNADGSTTPTERLSIGKYLGGATSINTSGGGSSSGGSSTPGSDTAAINELRQNIADLRAKDDELDQQIDDLDDAKQDKLTAGDYIKIVNDEVSLDLTELEDYLADTLNLDSAIDIQYDSTNDILKWTKDGTTWTNLLDLSALSGDYVSTDELEQAIAGLAAQSDLAALAGRVETAEGAIEELQAAVDNIPAAQVNADWNATSGVAQILNKPTIPTADEIVSPSELETALADKQDKLTFDTTPTAGSTNPVTSAGIKEAIAQAQLDGQVDLTDYVQDSELADVAFSGDYADLENTPTLATVATSGDYDDLTNKPTIPAAQVNSDWNATTGVAQILNKPTNLATTDDLADYATTSAMNTALAEKADADDLETLAGTVADKQDALTEAQLAAVNSGVTSTTVAQVAANTDAIAIQDQALATKANAADLATVATSGSYNDLENKPTIPDAQVNSDWNASTGVAQILNKPDLSNYVERPEVPSGDGDYLLKINNDGGTTTYSWVDATDYDNASGGGGGNDPTGPDFDWDDEGWGDGE